MCYSGTCPHELWSGECGKKPSELCPASFETDEDYEKAAQVAQDSLDDYGDYLYERQKDAKYESR